MTPSNGYMLVYMPNHPRATTSGMVYEHILVGRIIVIIGLKLKHLKDVMLNVVCVKYKKMKSKRN